MSTDTHISFKAPLEIIGINPFVFIPEEYLAIIFTKSGKNKGHIPLQVSVNGAAYLPQTLLRYQGEWRLYINTKMLKDSPKRIQEVLTITLKLDNRNRSIDTPPQLLEAMQKNPAALQVFESLTPSLRKEIVRYIAQLKTDESRERNVRKAVDFLLGNGSFVGRNSPPKSKD